MKLKFPVCLLILFFNLAAVGYGTDVSNETPASAPDSGNSSPSSKADTAGKSDTGNKMGAQLNLPAANTSPTDTPTPVIHRTPVVTKPGISVIPNPARGKKLSFRIMAPSPSKVFIRVYNRNFDPVTVMEQEGEQLFDVMWNLQKVPEGLYYYQAQLEAKDGGKLTKFPMKKFAVIKDEVPAVKP